MSRRRRISLKSLSKRVDVLLLSLAVCLIALLLEFFGEGKYDVIYEKLGLPPMELASPFSPQNSYKEVPAADKDSVRFLMWNVKNYFVDGEPRRTAYQLYFKPIAARDAVADVIVQSKADVVGLVEMGGRVALEDLQARLRARGRDYPYSFVLERQGDDRSLALLSLYPIVRNESVAQCALYGNQKKRMLRGILDVEVALEDGRHFCFVGAHLKSRVAEDQAAARSLRAREARTLAMHVHERMRQENALPIVVFGDWNDGPSDESLGVLSQGIAASSALYRIDPRDKTDAAWTIYYAPQKEYYIFDQIYMNKRMYDRLSSPRSMGIMEDSLKKKASDHRAVWCDLR